jgi:ribosomal protein S18 acetylase RimI-like enzyme
MTESEFQRYRQHLIEGYAADKVRAGTWRPEESMDRSEQEINELLPQGVLTPDHYLFSIHDEAAAKDIGILWFAVTRWGGKDQAFIYDIEIAPEQRSKGYGSQALIALEDKVKTLGLDRIGLHVFGHNPRALKLYEKLGYEITNIHMAKQIE